MVSGLTKLDVIQRVWEHLDKAIEQGLSFQDFRKAAVHDLGDTWLSEDSARLETIYRNNVQSAFAAGRYLQATSPDALEQHPVWMLDVVMDSRTSDVCEPLDGVKRRATDPWWQGRIPPLHHNCRTGLLTLTEEDAHEMGGLTDPAPDPKGQEGWGARPELDEWKGDPPSYAPELQTEARRVVEEARNVGSPLASPGMPNATPERKEPVEPPPKQDWGSDEGPVRMKEAEPYGGYEIPRPPVAPAGDDGPDRKKGPNRDVRPPNARHLASAVRPTHRTKGKNTIILPHVSVGNDIEAIRAGNAEPVRMDAGWGWRVNGRLYGVEPRGTVYPIEGPGFVPMSRPKYNALKAFVRAGGDEAKARRELDALGLSEGDLQEVRDVLASMLRERDG